jgi:hypothetical protein
LELELLFERHRYLETSSYFESTFHIILLYDTVAKQDGSISISIEVLHLIKIRAMPEKSIEILAGI